MSKRKKQRRLPRPRRTRRRHEPAVDLEKILSRADSLIARGRALEAVDLLEPLLPSYPRATDLHYYVGYARVKAGDTWGGLVGYERAMGLSRNPRYWLPLASLYLELELNAHALHAFRQVLQHQADTPMADDVREAVASLQKDISETSENLGLPVAQVERGLRFLEEGQRALHDNDLPACIRANRQAIKLLAQWPPPRNNLSLALFVDGQPEEAIATARGVLAQFPENIQALSNAIRFLAWTGQEAEARTLWSQLKGIAPQWDSDRLKMAEAAAIMEDDESVYRLLKPLDQSEAAPGRAFERSWQAQFYLAIAEANTGRRAARRRLQRLQHETPWAGDLLAALEAGQPGLGWADRFPYFHSSELLPRRRIEEFVELVSRRDEVPPRRFRSQVASFVARFPQVVHLAEKMIWEDDQPKGGVAILATVATPAAHAALRRFGLSQAGADEARMQALISLVQAGEIEQDETLRVWSRGEWREVQLREYEISDESEAQYDPRVADLLNQGLQAFQQDDLGKAERLFHRALALDPRAKEAYNNLGTIFARRGEHERAKEMYRETLQIDPTYVFPRCNLAVYLLDEGDVDGAAEMLAPLADVTRLRPQEMAFYSYTQARILMQREEFDGACRALEVALEVYPGYELAQDLLDHLKGIIPLLSGFESILEEQRRRDRAKRVRLQTELSQVEPTLFEALSIYTKGALTAIGRVVLPWGGWSALRKAELRQRIIEGLQDPHNLERIVADLSGEERTALRQVLANDGDMPWQDFDAEYGNDLEESPHWEYHEPGTVMGRLRLCGLLVEATVEGLLLITIPAELRPLLSTFLD